MSVSVRFAGSYYTFGCTSGIGVRDPWFVLRFTIPDPAHTVEKGSGLAEYCEGSLKQYISGLRLS